MRATFSTLALSATCAVITGLAQPASVDGTFNSGAGFEKVVNALAIQPDGRFVVGGDFTTVNGSNYASLVRLSPGGLPDTSFDLGIGFNDQVRCVVVQPDGKILVGGDFTFFNGTAQQHLARLHPNGTLDATFNRFGGVDGAVYALALQPDGRVLVGGAFQNCYGTARGRITRLLPDGSLDATFTPGTGANGSVRALAIQPDGKIIVAGDFRLFNGTTAAHIARLEAIGSLDPTFVTGSGANDTIHALALQPDGRMVIAGELSRYDGTNVSRVIRLEASGARDVSFSVTPSPNNTVYSLVLEADGQVVIGGLFTQVAGEARNRLARLSAVGTLDATFDAGAMALPNVAYGVQALALQEDGRIVLGGGFTNIAGTVCMRIARLNGDPVSPALRPPMIVVQPADATVREGWPAGATVVAEGTPPLYYQWRFKTNDLAGATNAVLETGAVDLRNAGNYSVLVSNAAGSVLSRTAVLTVLPAEPTDGSVVMDFASSNVLSSYVNCLLPTADGKMYAGGAFTAAGGTGRNRVARFNADGTLDTTFAPNGGPNSYVYCLATNAAGKLFVGGDFSTVNGTNRTRLALMTDTGGVDTNWVAGFTPSDTVRCLALQPDGKLLVGGDFTGPTNPPAGSYNRLARLNSDGSLDATFITGAGPSDAVYTMLVQPDGKILVGGVFTKLNGVTCGRIGRLNADGSLDSTFQLGVGFPQVVYSLALQPDGKIVVGGYFQSYDGVTRYHAARLHSDGQLDALFDTSGFNEGGNPPARSVVLQPDGKTIVGGQFTQFNGISRPGIVRLNSDGGVDLTFDAGVGVDGSVFSVVWQSSGLVWIGGNFTAVGGQPCKHIAQLHVQDFTAIPLPVIWTHPADQIVALGAPASFAVEATSYGPLDYQWFRAGATNTPLPFQTNSTLYFTAVQTNLIGEYYVVLANVSGVVTSQVARLDFYLPPVITAQPTNVTVLVGEPASFSVSASGFAPLQYQWFQTGPTSAPLASQTNAVLQFSAAQTNQAGDYFVTVANASGAVTSQVARLTVLGPPTITTQPWSQSVVLGETATFSAEVRGTASLSYEWRKDGVPIPGAAASSLTLSNAQYTDAASYTLFAWDDQGSVLSTAAVLEVLPYPPTHFIEAARHPGFLSGVAEDIVVQGDYAVVAAAYGGMELFDIQNAADPRPLSGFTSPLYGSGGIYTVSSSTNYSYPVGAHGNAPLSDLFVLDIRNPLAPVQVGVCSNLSHTGDSTMLVGEHVYVGGAAATNGPRLSIVNVSNPTNPVVVGRCFTNGLVDGLDVVGRYAYVCHILDSTRLVIVDVLDPANPVEMGSCELPGWFALNVRVVGNRALVAGDDLYVIDVSDPNHPVRVPSSFPFDGIAFMDVEVAGDYAYVASRKADAPWYKDVLILALNQFTNMTYVGGVELPNDPYRIKVRNDRAYVADFYYGLQILDVSSPTNPSVLGSFESYHRTRHVQVDGAHAYLANRLGMEVVDIRNPRQPRRVGSELLSTTVQGHKTGSRYYAAQEGHGLSEVDVSDPANPTPLLHWLYLEEAVRAVQVVNGLVYICESNGLAVLPVSTLSLNPGAAPIERRHTASETLGVVVSGNLVFQPTRETIGGAGYEGLEIYRMSDQGYSPTFLSRFISTNAVRNVYVAGNYAYLVGAGLRILDISDPAHPVSVGYHAGVWGLGVQVLGNTAYVSGTGLNVFDVSDKANPVLLSSFPTAQDAFHVQVAGKYAYVAHDEDGLLILEGVYAPFFKVQPLPQTVLKGEAVSLTAEAGGNGTLAYQWLRNGTNVPGATDATFSLTSAQTNDSGTFSLVVSNVYGATTSAPALLTVVGDPVLPTITGHPASQTVLAGTNVTFTVAADGTQPLHYQWTKNSTNLPGQIQSTLALHGVRVSDAGQYSAIVYNAAGPVVSAPATLTVIPQQPGTPDAGFNVPCNSIVGTALNEPFRSAPDFFTAVRCVAGQPDGKVIAGGTFTHVKGVNRNNLARLNEDGSVDLSFAPPLAAKEIVTALALRADGTILVATCTADYGNMSSRLVRLLPSGNLDPAFTQVDSLVPIYAIAIQPDQKMIVGGYFSSLNGVARRKLARLEENGALDTSFEPAFLYSVLSYCSSPFQVEAVALQPDGKVLIGGGFSVYLGGGFQRGVARLNADGTLDGTFQATHVPNGNVHALALQTDGRVLVGGDFRIPGRQVARYLPDGNLDTSFSSPGFALSDAENPVFSQKSGACVRALAVQPNGAVIAAGDFRVAGSYAREGVARLLPDGQVDPTFGEKGPRYDWCYYRAVALAPDGRVWVGGGEPPEAYYFVAALRRLEIEGGQPGCAPPVITQGLTDLAVPRGQSATLTITASGPEPLRYQWQYYGINLTNATNASFTITNVTDGAGRTFGLYSVVAYNPGGAVSASANVLFPKLSTLELSDVGGSTKRVVAGGSHALSVKVNSTSPFSLQWYFNGAPIPGATSADLLLTNVQYSQAGVYAAVATNATLTTGKNLYNLSVFPAVPPGFVDTTFSPATAGTIEKVLVQPDQRIVIVGGFTQVNGVPCGGIARLNPDGQLDPTFNLGGIGFGADSCYPHPDCLDAALDGDGKILVCGVFPSYNGERVQNVARLFPDGRLDTNFACLFFPGTEPNSLVVEPDGKIIIGGWFANRLARCWPDGSVDASFVPSGWPTNWNALDVVRQPDGKLLVSGEFEQYSELTQTRVFRLNPDGSLDSGYSHAPGFLCSGYTENDPSLKCVALQPDGKILVGGYFTKANGVYRVSLARLLPTGAADPDFVVGSGFHTLTWNDDPWLWLYGLEPYWEDEVGIVRSVAVQPDGKILVAGDFNRFNGAVVTSPIRLNPDGSLDASFQAETFRADELTILPDGRIMSGGEGTSVARFFGGELSPTPALFPLFVRPSGTNIAIGLFGEPRRNYRLLSSQDLTTWEWWPTNIITVGSANVWFPINITPDRPHRFFRATWVP